MHLRRQTGFNRFDHQRTMKSSSDREPRARNVEENKCAPLHIRRTLYIPNDKQTYFARSICTSLPCRRVHDDAGHADFTPQAQNYTCGTFERRGPGAYHSTKRHRHIALRGFRWQINTRLLKRPRRAAGGQISLRIKRAVTEPHTASE
jgi:hypothetical protein